ncbi:hypothetical protein COBT_001853, partial [Conglomerata obtusa]
MSSECFKNFFIGFFVIIVCLGLLTHYQRPTDQDNEFLNHNARSGESSNSILPYRNNETVASCINKYKPTCAYLNNKRLFKPMDKNALKFGEFMPENFCKEHCKNIDQNHCTNKLHLHTKGLYSNCPSIFCDPLWSNITYRGTDSDRHKLSDEKDNLPFKKVHFYGPGEFTDTIFVKTFKPNIYGINIEDCEPLEHQDLPKTLMNLESAYNNKFGHLANPVFKALHVNAFFVCNEDESAYLMFENSKMIFDAYKLSLDMWKTKVSKNGKDENSYFKNPYSTEMTPTNAKIYLHNSYTAALYEIFQPFCVGCSDGITIDRQNGVIMNLNNNFSFMVVNEMQKIEDFQHQIYKFQT